MTTTKKININGMEISVLLQGNENDYICLTDMARFKDQKRTDYIIQNWMRSRSTIEYLGVWEQLHNPKFNPIEFDGFRQQAGLNAFSLTPKEWAEKTNAIVATFILIYFNVLRKSSCGFLTNKTQNIGSRN
ncbi:MAG: KilA-N domain-containing protein [Bacteroidaceae bacterium]|nr:KilA-N domain-containing protein [Bacteroidaceae bacterium]